MVLKNYDAQGSKQQADAALAGTNTKKHKQQPTSPPESWDDVDSSETELEPEPEQEQEQERKRESTKSQTNVAAVNPVSSAYTDVEFVSPFAAHEPDASRSSLSQQRRPEKQTAVASRLIAGALGIRAAKRTPQQRAYDKAMREKETRRLEKERSDTERKRLEEEKAKAAFWED